MSVRIVDLVELRDRVHVFKDRADAGAFLAGAVNGIETRNTVLLAIPAGGVPVAVPLAASLGLPLDVAVVSKITLPYNTEVGMGAISFDGRVELNEVLLPHLALTPEDVAAAVARTRATVERRLHVLREDLGAPAWAGRDALLVDDGLASGFTLRAAAHAVLRAGAHFVDVAVPTAHRDSIRLLADCVRTLYCANLRGGRAFAVADAYQQWHDVTDDEVVALLKSAHARVSP